MPIRTALPSDLDRIVELGSQSLTDGPYAGIIDDVPAQSRKCAEQVMQAGTILLAETDDRVVGLLGFILADHHFSGQRYAAELMWYVLPEYRASTGGSPLGLQLLEEAQLQAKQMGAREMVFTAPNDAIAKAYERMGYSKLEVTYRKAL